MKITSRSLRELGEGLPSRIISREGEAFLGSSAKLTAVNFFVVMIAAISQLYAMRQYGPDQIGLFAMYSIAAGMFGMAGTGKYELVVFRKEVDVRFTTSVFYLCILALSFVAAVASVLGAVTLQLLKVNYLYWFSFFPLSIVMIGANLSLQAFLNRAGDFNALSMSRIILACCTSLATLWASFYIVDGGLILAVALGLSVTVTYQLSVLKKKGYLGKLELKGVLSSAAEYRSHPLLLAPSQLIGIFGQQLPIYVISAAYSSGLAGYYSVASKITYAPTQTLGNAVGDVFKHQVIERKGSNFLPAVFLIYLASAISIGLAFYAVVYFFGESLLALLLGPEWKGLEEFLLIMLVAGLFQLSLSPLDKPALTHGKTKYIFGINSLRATLVSAVCLFVLQAETSIFEFLWMIVAAQILIYCIDGIVNWNLIKGVRVGHRKLEERPDE